MAINDSKSADLRSNGSVAKASRLNAVDWLALVLLIVGGVNWALVGLFNFDLVATLFGPMSLLSRVVYILVGIAALYGIAMAVRINNPQPRLGV